MKNYREARYFSEKIIFIIFMWTPYLLRRACLLFVTTYAVAGFGVIPAIVAPDLGSIFREIRYILLDLYDWINGLVGKPSETTNIMAKR